EEAAILTIDGVGEWATASICHGRGKDIKILKELHFPDSLGLLYSAFTYFLGFKVNFGEYKLMGLAPYGNLHDEQTQDFIQRIQDKLIDIKEDGSLSLKREYFTFATGDRMIDEKRWAALFGLPRRNPESPFEQQHCNLAIAIQKVTEEVVLKLAATAVKLTNCRKVCLAGGVALNCVANGELLRSGIVDELWIQPAAGDAGGSLGAALAAHYLYFDQTPGTKQGQDFMQGAYLGPEYSAQVIERVAKRYEAPFERYTKREALNQQVAKALEEGAAVGWYQGRQEFGPRALGNRSILGDPRNPEMQRKLNLKIKFRESFRPFAPSVLAEDKDAYFDLNADSPYMLLVAPVQEARRSALPENYDQLAMKNKINVQRSDVPAITHIDFSARVQTVHQETNPHYYNLIAAFRARTGYGVLVNTSFNVRGEPVVCSPEDAYRCFMRTNMDYLVMGNYLFKKTDQPQNEKTAAIQEQTFALD
ncbi:MAG: carbamoyltransferase C-terminal domain-containing protein, partial [Bacteroidota bacterium]